jgi:ABC-type transporter Mla MlaB component
MTDTFTLPAELSIYTVAELAPAWRSQLATPHDDALTIDATAVEQIDAAGVQLLLSLWRAAARSGRALHWTGASTVLTTACTALGVATTLGLAEAAA